MVRYRFNLPKDTSILDLSKGILESPKDEEIKKGNVLITEVKGFEDKSGKRVETVWAGTASDPKQYALEGWKCLIDIDDEGKKQYEKNSSGADKIYKVGEEIKVSFDTVFEGVWGRYYAINYIANGYDDEDDAYVDGGKMSENGEYSEYYRQGETIMLPSVIIDGQSGNSIQEENPIFNTWETSQGTQAKASTLKTTTYAPVTEVTVGEDATKVQAKFEDPTGKTGVVRGNHQKTRNNVKMVSFGAAPKAKVYKVTYDANFTAADKDVLGGTLPGEVTCLDGTDVIVSFPELTRPKHTFIGWNTDQAATSGLTSFTMGTKDVTLYAVRTKIPKVYGINGEEATVVISVESTYDSANQTIKIGGFVPTKADHTFTGWQDLDDIEVYQPGDTIMVDGDKYLVATWKKDTYWVSLTYYNGNDELHKETVEKGTSVTIYGASQLGASKDGYEFDGWNTRSDGKGIPYGASATILMNSDVDLCAMWTKEDEPAPEPEPEPEPEPQPQPEDQTSGFVQGEQQPEPEAPAFDEEPMPIATDSEIGEEEEVYTPKGMYIVRHIYYTVKDGSLTEVETYEETLEEGTEIVPLEKDGFKYKADDVLDMVYDEEMRTYTVTLRYYDEEEKAIKWVDDIVDTGMPLMATVVGMLILVAGVVVLRMRVGRRY